MRQDNTTLLFGKGHLGGFILKKNPEISWTQRKDSQGKLFFELENYENFSLPTQIKTIIWTIPPHTMTVPFLTKLPRNIQITHQSLFDNSIEGIKLKSKPVFSVQYHPESNPGPQDSVYLFEEFIKSMKKNAKKKRY